MFLDHVKLFNVAALHLDKMSVYFLFVSNVLFSDLLSKNTSVIHVFEYKICSDTDLYVGFINTNILQRGTENTV